MYTETISWYINIICTSKLRTNYIFRKDMYYYRKDLKKSNK